MPVKNKLEGITMRCDESLGPTVCLHAEQGVPNAGAMSSITFTMVTKARIDSSGLIKVYLIRILI